MRRTISVLLVTAVTPIFLISCNLSSDEVSITLDRLSVCGFNYTSVTVDDSGRITAIASGNGVECLQPSVPEGNTANWRKAIDAIATAEKRGSAHRATTVVINGVKITKTTDGYLIFVE